jgi:molybdopterin-guanine dinucleotide biosynthesis protein A
MNCYVLVGGRSSRMGRSKLDLPFAGSTFLERVIAASRPIFDDVIAVQRNGGSPIDSLPTIFEPAHDEAAPVLGVMRALQDTDGICFVLAIDYPLLTKDVLRYLSDRVEKSNAPLVVPRWNDKLQLLCGGYSRLLLPRIEERVAEGRLDLRGLADQAEIVEENELRTRFAGEPLMNVNTPEELQEAARLL